MQKFVYLIHLVILFLTLLLLRCANPMTPQGGPKDITSPLVVSCSPPNQSTWFKGKEIRVTFNEFIQLKSPGIEMFISPPLPEKPTIKLHGKTVLIQFEDTLLPSTTYIINFGKAIADITENNTCENLMYIFSTGDAIDSLQIHGAVSDAFTNNPEPGVFVFLYANNHDTIPFDSLPYRVPPRYMTRTNDKGDFTLSNLALDQYKVFALNDKSGDLIFNTSDERIAFSDSLITPIPPLGEPTDSLASDSLSTDSLLTLIQIGDTLVSESVQTPVSLRMFEEIDSTQDVMKAQLVKNDQFMIVFKFPTHDLRVEPLNPDSIPPWIKEINKNHDTLFLWTTAPLPDTLGVIVYDRNRCLDTLHISTTINKREKPIKKESEDHPPPPPALAFQWGSSQGEFNFFRSILSATLSYPVTSFQPNQLFLITGKDTILLPPISFTDSLKRTFTVTYPWKESTTYSILIPDSVFTAYNGISNDTIIHTFKTITSRELGSLLVNVDLPGTTDQYIFQLQNEQGGTLEESKLTASGKIRFPFIKPAKYKIKAILDHNKNGHWDTGSYLNNIQPESVYFFPGIIEIRGNWDVEEDWKIQ